MILNGFFIPVIIVGALILGAENGEKVGEVIGGAIGWTAGAAADGTRAVANWAWPSEEERPEGTEEGEP